MKLQKGEDKTASGYRYRYMKDGKRTTITAPTLAELRRKKERILNPPENVQTPVTLSEKISEMLEIKRNIKHTTLKTYYFWFNTIKKTPLLQQSIYDITSADIRRWIAELDDEGYSQSSISGYITALIKPAFQLAIEEDLIRKNPADFMITTAIKKPGHKTRSLTDEEQKIFYDFLITKNTAQAERNRDLLIFSMETGLRPAEQCALTVSDIDFIHNEISVNKQLIFEGKNYRIETTKSSSGERIVPLSPRAMVALHNAMKDPVDPRFSIDGFKGFIFKKRDGLPMTRHTLEKRYMYLAKKIDEETNGITKLRETTLYSLRHTYCSNLIENGINISAVQYLMGHKSAKVTLEVYAHAQTKSVREGVKKMYAMTNYDQ